MPRHTCRRSLIAAGMLFACGDSARFTPLEPTPPAQPASLSILSGADQEGKWGELLSQPFKVIVRDSGGLGIENIPVTWTVVAGTGGFGSPHGDAAVSRTLRTWHGGISEIFLAPGLGTTDVQATAEGLEQSVTFTVTANVSVVTFDHWFGSILNPRGHTESGDLSIPLGTVVEWVGIPHVASTTVPPGGASFEQILANPTARFQFTPTVTGTWRYVSDPKAWKAWQDWGWCTTSAYCDTAEPLKGVISVY